MCLNNLHCVHATNRLHLRPKAASKHSGQEVAEQHAEDMVGLWKGLHWQLKPDGGGFLLRFVSKDLTTQKNGDFGDLRTFLRCYFCVLGPDIKRS